jgi:hypothetical protein
VVHWPSDWKVGIGGDALAILEGGIAEVGI